MSLDAPTIIFVCTTCRQGAELFEPAQNRSGFKLYNLLQAAAGEDIRFNVQPVECLNSCDRSCAVTFAAKGKWSYGFGDVDAATQITDILNVALLHYEAHDGVIPWFERPEAIRAKSMNRTPPLL